MTFMSLCLFYFFRRFFSSVDPILAITISAIVDLIVIVILSSYAATTTAILDTLTGQI